MGKTKSEDELLRFVWKRNLKYDLQLLCEVESQNPYASDKPKEVWTLIAKILREGALKMKVTERSCRERVNELLKNHRKNELKSLQASGISEEEMSELIVLLTSVSTLEETKSDKKLAALYSKKDRAEANAIRSSALADVGDSDSSDDSEAVNQEAKKSRKSQRYSDDEDEDDDDDLDLGSKRRRSNPKKDLVVYLERKSEKELRVRKEELRIREKEAGIREKEVANKAAEIEILRQKVDADADERKKITDLLLKLAAQK